MPQREDPPEWLNPLDEPAAGDASPPGSLADLAPEMVWRLPGCADLAVRKALQWAWSEFCVRTGAFRVRVRAEPRGEGPVRLLPLAPPVAAHHVRVVHALARVDTPPPRPVPESGHRPGWRARPGGLVEIPAFLAPDGSRFAALCELAPDPGAESVPLPLLRLHAEALVSGALWMLMSQSARPWSDPASAAAEGVRWRNALSRAARHAVAADGGAGTGRSCIVPHERWA